MPPQPRTPTLAERIRRREQVLAAVVETPHDAIAAKLRTAGIAVFVRVGSAADIETAFGADGLLIDSGATNLEALAQARHPHLAVLVDAGTVDDGRVRVVTSVDRVRAALASRADVVIYDVPVMVDELITALAHGRDSTPVDREPLVLLSGMLGDASLWDGVARRLNDIARPWAARIDLDDSVPAMAESVLAEAPPAFSLVGHSLGAIVALEIMRRAPERVHRLALINASARGPVDAQQRAWAQWRKRVDAGGFADVADELALTTLPPDRRDDVELVHANRAMALTVGAEGLLRQLAAQSTRPDNRPILAGIAVPVLVVSGELDEVCPLERQRELAAGCPDAELRGVPGAGHMLPLERPDELAALLRSWLQRSPSRPQRG